MKRSRPRQHVRKTKSGKKIIVNRGVKKAKRRMPIRQEPKDFTVEVDPYIQPILGDLNAEGLITTFSCSGLECEHPNNSPMSRPYLTISLPKDVAIKDIDLDAVELSSVLNVLKPKEVERYMSAGKRAGWNADIIAPGQSPMLRFSEPGFYSWGNDDSIKEKWKNLRHELLEESKRPEPQE